MGACAVTATTPTDPGKSKGNHYPKFGPLLAVVLLCTAAPVHSAGTGQTYGPVRPGETLWRIAGQAYPGARLDRDQVMLALLEANPDAVVPSCNVNGVLRVGAWLALPAPEQFWLRWFISTRRKTRPGGAMPTDAGVRAGSRPARFWLRISTNDGAAPLSICGDSYMNSLANSMQSGTLLLWLVILLVAAGLFVVGSRFMGDQPGPTLSGTRNPSSADATRQEPGPRRPPTSRELGGRHQ